MNVARDIFSLTSPIILIYVLNYYNFTVSIIIKIVAFYLIYYTPELLHVVKVTEIFDAEGNFYCYISLRLYFKLIINCV